VKATVFLLAASLAAAASAQSAAVTATLEPRRLAAGEVAILRLEFRGGLAPRSAPSLSLRNFDEIAGPSIENRFEWINGKSASQTTLTYDLRAGRPGPASVGPLKFSDSSGRAIETPELLASVTEPAAAPPPSSAASAGDPALVEKLDPPSPFVGQQAIWTLYLVTRREPARVELRAAPDFRGFWSEDLERDSAAGPPRTWFIDGVPWQAYRVARKALFPNRPGAIEIGEAAAAVTMRADIFDFLSPLDEARVGIRRAAPLRVVCRPAGGIPVGTFSWRASVDRRRLATGESAALTAQLSGDGRISDAAAPVFRIKGARASEPETRLTLRRSPDRVTWTRIWEWAVTPEASGRVAIPPLTIPVRDAAGKATTLSADAGSIEVSAAPQPSSPAARLAPPRTPAAAPMPWLLPVCGAGAALLLLAAGFAAGHRLGRRAPEPLVDPELAPEDRAARLIERLRAVVRAQSVLREIDDLARRLEEARYGPVLSARGSETADIARQAEALARRLGTGA
jgi:hypothetical protein